MTLTQQSRYEINGKYILNHFENTSTICFQQYQNTHLHSDPIIQQTNNKFRLANLCQAETKIPQEVENYFLR